MLEERSKVCITGHLGFIGSHLWTALESKYDLIGIDLKDGNDIRNVVPDDLAGVDFVVHLAAQPQVQLSIDQPVFTNSHNVEGTLNMLECSRITGVKKFIFSSSCAVYGNSNVLPVSEGMWIDPLSPYALQKLIGEHYVALYATLYGLDTISLRYFNVFGENMPADNAYASCIASFIKQKKEGISLTIFGGEQSRDFVYVKDVVSAIEKSMEIKTPSGIVMNIGSGNKYTINEIANAVSKNQKHLPQRKGEPFATLADISRARNLLGFEPTINVIDWLCVQ